MNSVDAYGLLADPIRRVLWDLKWESLRQIQIEAIEAILQSSDDLIIAARTASGKTEAAFLPILSDISPSPRGSVRALYVGPLKALINDQFRRLEALCERAEIPVHRWHGDVSQQKKQLLLKKPGGVLLITPESLEAMFVTKTQALRSVFHNVSFIVIDELHALEGSERGTHLRSLLARLERYHVGSPRLVALSATLGDPGRSAHWMRPDDPSRVRVLQDGKSQKAIRFGIFACQPPALNSSSAASPIDSEEEVRVSPGPLADDLFEAFRTDRNLVFANSRADVEWYCDELNQRARQSGRADQFLVHHGALSKAVREHTELLMQGHVPYTTVCSATLELGIDIGNVTAVGQIGCPWSVSSLVQRLGRSGRRDDQPQVMRLYLLEQHLRAESHLCDRLRPDLLQAIALTELMLDKWVEPPEPAQGDLSTLVQQILSSIAETGGLTARDLFERLITRGAFRHITQSVFVEVLRCLGEWDLIEQTPPADLILGLKGEQIVNRFDFYSAFATSPEYRVACQAEVLGMLPTTGVPSEGDHLLLAGRRWQVIAIDHDQREVSVRPARGRKAPLFSGDGGAIHLKVRQKMRDVLLSASEYPYVNATGQELLAKARTAAGQAGLADSPLIPLSASTTLWFPWVGTHAQTTLALLLTRCRLRVTVHDVALEIDAAADKVRHALAGCHRQLPAPAVLAKLLPGKERRKYDWCLSDDLLTWSIEQDVINLPEASLAISELLGK